MIGLIYFDEQSLSACFLNGALSFQAGVVDFGDDDARPTAPESKPPCQYLDLRL
jgi:hypothetical protein